MFRVRPTIRGILAAVAIIGLDLAIVCGAIQAEESEPCTSNLLFPALMFVPPLSLLTLAAVSVGLGVVRRGRASSFATGYLLLGGMASLGVCLDLAAGTGQLSGLKDHIEGFSEPLRAPGVPEARLTTVGQSMFDGWPGVILLIVICALPQLVLGVMGGALASRYGLAIVRTCRKMPLGPKGTVTRDPKLTRTAGQEA
jgi:hypothetical protein